MLRPKYFLLGQWLEGKLLELEVLALEGHEAISPEEQLEVSRREVAVSQGQGWVFFGNTQSHHKHTYVSNAFMLCLKYRWSIWVSKS